MLVLATFASHCGGNENLQTVLVANSLAIQTLCEEGNIPAAELLQNECEEIISCLGEECQTTNRYVFSIAKSQLSLCKGLVRFKYSRITCFMSAWHGLSQRSNRLYEGHLKIWTATLKQTAFGRLIVMVERLLDMCRLYSMITTIDRCDR